METVVAAVWGELLGLDRVGRYDNFVELGGHSLITARVVSRLREMLNLETPLGDVFARPVLADFASKVSEASPTLLPPVTPAETEDRNTLSFAQKRLWFLAQLEGASKAYHISELGEVVPQNFRTGGTWIWTDTVTYYLETYALSPDPELLDHIRNRGYVEAELDDVSRHRAMVELFRPVAEGSAHDRSADGEAGELRALEGELMGEGSHP